MGIRGFYGIGVEGISKPMNFGNLARSAHGFGASFIFTIAPAAVIGLPKSDTTQSQNHVPWYSWDSVEEMHLPDKCQLIGVELTPDAIDLPSFRHPPQAAYILGPEGGSLSPQATEACEFIVKIPMNFCINVAMAGAVVMYDRMRSSGRFAERPVRVGRPLIPLKPHIHGKPAYSGGKKIATRHK